VIAATLVLGAAAMIIADIAAPGVLGHAGGAIESHAQALVDRLQWISLGLNADDMAVAGGFIAEMIATVALIIVAVGWAERRGRRALSAQAAA
jgi:hypothetical protein